MDDSKGLSYFFLGLGLGVAVGMIMAPQSGPETRNRIRSKATEGGEFLRRRGTEFREGASGLVDRGRDAVGRQRDQFNSAINAGREAYRETVSPEQRSTAHLSDPEEAGQGI